MIFWFVLLFAVFNALNVLPFRVQKNILSLILKHNTLQTILNATINR